MRYLPVRYGLSQRRADENDLRQRLHALAIERPRFGYRRLTVLSRRAGLRVHHTRVDRLDQAEGLAVRRRERKRGAGLRREVWRAATGPDQRWSLDLLSDALAQGRRRRVLGVLDAFTESFNGRQRDECLNQRWILNLTGTRLTIEAWRQDYHRQRPHSSLAYRTPEEFCQDAIGRPNARI